MPRTDRPFVRKTKVLDSSAGDDPSSMNPEGLLPVLIVLAGHEIGRCYPIERTQLRIGRDPDRADLVVAGDESVSSVHARLTIEGGEVCIEDAGSTNGTLVGGRRITGVRRLAEGDRIALGETILKYGLHDRTEAAFHANLDLLMNVDELTGLPVQRVFKVRLATVLDRARQRGETLVFLMMDMDGLKRINDTHGHQVGAGTIAEVGRILGDTVAGRGEASRFGGDEFSAFLAPCSREEGRTVAETIRRRVATHSFDIHGVRVHPTMSIGFASMPRDGQSIGELFTCADAALYRAKRAGRNRVSD